MGASQLTAKLNKTQAPHWFCRKQQDDYPLWLDFLDFLPENVDCWLDNVSVRWKKTSKKTSKKNGGAGVVFGDNPRGESSFSSEEIEDTTRTSSEESSEEVVSSSDRVTGSAPPGVPISSSDSASSVGASGGSASVASVCLAGDACNEGVVVEATGLHSEGSYPDEFFSKARWKELAAAAAGAVDGYKNSNKNNNKNNVDVQGVFSTAGAPPEEGRSDDVGDVDGVVGEKGAKNKVKGP